MINSPSNSVVNFCELFVAEFSKSGSSSAVERLLAKEEVASSNLVFRSSAISWRRSQVDKAGVCKTLIQRFESARRLISLAEVAEWQTRRT